MPAQAPQSEPHACDRDELDAANRKVSKEEGTPLVPGDALDFSMRLFDLNMDGCGVLHTLMDGGGFTA